MYIPAGIRSVSLATPTETVTAFVTRKVTDFTGADIVNVGKGEVSIKRGEYVLTVKANAVRIDAETVAAVHDGVKTIAGVCNGAQSWDGAGFSKIDTRIGKSLAEARSLSPAQTFIAARLVNKYRKQLVANGLGHLVEIAGTILPPVKAKAPKAEQVPASHSCEDMDGECCEI